MGQSQWSYGHQVLRRSVERRGPPQQSSLWLWLRCRWEHDLEWRSIVHVQRRKPVEDYCWCHIHVRRRRKSSKEIQRDGILGLRANAGKRWQRKFAAQEYLGR